MGSGFYEESESGNKRSDLRLKDLFHKDPLCRFVVTLSHEVSLCSHYGLFRCCWLMLTERALLKITVTIPLRPKNI